MKIVLITNILTPYRMPLFREISKALTPHRFEVWLTADSQLDRKWALENVDGFHFKYLGGKTLQLDRERFFYFNPSLIWKLLRVNPDLVISAEYSFPTLIALTYTRLFQKKHIIWTGCHSFTEQNISAFKTNLRKFLTHLTDGFIVYGSLSKDYLTKVFQVNPSKIFIGQNTVDVEFYLKIANRYRRTDKSQLKKQKAFPEFVVLYVGTFIERKGLINLIRACSEIQCEKIGLVLVGDGPQEASLRQLTNKLQLNNVFFEGYRQKEELAEYYALADVFVLPSLTEHWGLVVNEAMVFGLPVICSKYAGASIDIVIHEENGFIIDPNQTNELTQYLIYLMENQPVCRMMGQKSQTIIHSFRIQDSAQHFCNAIYHFLS